MPSLVDLYIWNVQYTIYAWICVICYWSMTSKRKRYTTVYIRYSSFSSISNSLRLTEFNSTHVKPFQTPLKKKKKNKKSLKGALKKKEIVSHLKTEYRVYKYIRSRLLFLHHFALNCFYHKPRHFFYVHFFKDGLPRLLFQHGFYILVVHLF